MLPVHTAIQCLNQNPTEALEQVSDYQGHIANILSTLRNAKTAVTAIPCFLRGSQSKA